MRTLKFARKSTHTARKEWRCTFCYVVRPAGTNYEQHVYMTDECDGPTIEKSCKGRELADVCEYWQKFTACFYDDERYHARFFHERIRAKDAEEAKWRGHDYGQNAEAHFLTIIPDGFDHRVETLRNPGPENWLKAAGMDYFAHEPELVRIPYLFWFRTAAEADTFRMMWGGKTIMKEAE